MDLSVIIPVFNGEKTLPELTSQIRNNLDLKYTYEVIYVYDCGIDNSWNIIKELVGSDPSHFRGYHLKRNYGQHNAILFGINEAKGDFIVTLDEDLQHNPSFIKELVEKQKEKNYDVVYASFKRLKHPGLRIMMSEWLRVILKRIVPGLFPGYSPFRLIKGEVARKILILRNSYTFIDGYLGMVTHNFGYIDADHFKRIDGVSSYSYLKLIKHAFMIAGAYSALKKWILISALVFNSLSISFLISGYMKGVSTHKISGMLTGTLGILMLICGLIAEAIHYRGIKTNSMPQETSYL
jgi:polyisoprenyl-phosphate glycosyltransferase